MVKRSDDEGIDVSFGKVINRDIDEDARRRRGTSSKSSKAKQRLRETKTEAEERITKRKSTEREEGYKKRDKERDAKKKKTKEPAVKERASTKSVSEKKKKPRKTTGELLSEGKLDRAKKRLDKFTGKALAVIGKIQGGDSESLQGQLMPLGAVTSESEFLNEYGRIYGNLQTIMRKMETNMLDPEKEYVSSKDVYALSTLYSQMRETIADMRSIKDMQAQAHSLSVEVIDPVMRATGEGILDFYYKTGQIVRQYVSDARVIEVIDAALKLNAAEQGQKIQAEFELAKSRIIDVLNGTK